MTEKVSKLPQSRDCADMQMLLKRALEAAEGCDVACGAIVLVSRTGEIEHYVNVGAHSLALLGAAETLKQFIYDYAFLEDE